MRIGHRGATLPALSLEDDLSAASTAGWARRLRKSVMAVPGTAPRVPRPDLRR
ncbi:MAG TPA: hypothetical protein VEL75_08975 [Candidatus Methylomirabilis sp.]|nr:hypothetical protein [Candidatus Methylomirabilis sp.]